MRSPYRRSTSKSSRTRSTRTSFRTRSSKSPPPPRTTPPRTTPPRTTPPRTTTRARRVGGGGQTCLPPLVRYHLGYDDEKHPWYPATSTLEQWTGRDIRAPAHFASNRFGHKKIVLYLAGPGGTPLFDPKDPAATCTQVRELPLKTSTVGDVLLAVKDMVRAYTCHDLSRYVFFGLRCVDISDDKPFYDVWLQPTDSSSHFTTSARRATRSRAAAR